MPSRHNKIVTFHNRWNLIFQLRDTAIIVPRGRDPFGQHWKSRPLARSNDIQVLNGFVNTIDWDQNQSDLSDLTQSMHRVTGSPWMADFRSWTWPEVVISVLTKRRIAASGDENRDTAYKSNIWVYHAAFFSSQLTDLHCMLKYTMYDTPKRTLQSLQRFSCYERLCIYSLL